MKLKPIYLLLATVIISWLGATANAQTIADLARRERERKKGDESKAVLTNATAAAAKASQSTSVTTGTPPAADKDKGKDKESQAAGAKPAAPGVQTDNKGRDEKYWRAAFDKAREEVKRAQGKVTVLDLKMNDLTSQLYREGRYNREMDIREQIAKTQQEQATAREELDGSQKKLSDLEDELRRSGGPPGWAR